MNETICIVASTLPIAFLARQAEALGVDRIVTTSEGLSRSYGFLTARVDRKIDVKRAPSGLLGQSLYFGLLVAKSRLFRQRLIIFHECCLPVLDLLILGLRPRGQHYPQVSMLGSIPMDIAMAPRSKMLTLLRLSRLSRLFSLYFSPPVGDNPGEYSLAVKAYPKSIESFPVGSFGPGPRHAEGAQRRHTILLLTSKSFAKDEDQIAIFRDVVRIADEHGWACEVKDHPNPYFRLGFADGSTRVLDPEMPSELLEDDYGMVVGTTSTGLLRYGNRAFSIVRMLKSLSDDEIGLAKRHFDMSAPGHQLRYLQDLQQLKLTLEGMD